MQKAVISSFVILVAIIAFAATPIPRWATTLWRHSPACSFRDTLNAIGERAKRHKAEDQIRGASRLLKQDPAGYEVWDTPQGSWWIAAGESRELFGLLSEQAGQIYGSGELGVRAGDVVLDCGAHVGIYTRQALKAGAAVVVAIEPAPENLECLRRNMADEIRGGRVIVYPKGVWDRDDFLTLTAGRSLSHSIVERSSDVSNLLKVPLTTIDKVVAELKLQRVDFMKMDIEGAEMRALSGAQKTLSDYKPRLAIAGYHNLDDPQKLPPVVLQAHPGYRMRCGPCYSARGIRPEVLFFQ